MKNLNNKTTKASLVIAGLGIALAPVYAAHAAVNTDGTGFVVTDTARPGADVVNWKDYCGDNYVTLHKVDEAGKPLAGATIEVTAPSGTLLMDGKYAPGDVQYKTVNNSDGSATYTDAGGKTLFTIYSTGITNSNGTTIKDANGNIIAAGDFTMPDKFYGVGGKLLYTVNQDTSTIPYQDIYTDANGTVITFAQAQQLKLANLANWSKDHTAGGLDIGINEDLGHVGSIEQGIGRYDILGQAYIWMGGTSEAVGYSDTVADALKAKYDLTSTKTYTTDASGDVKVYVVADPMAQGMLQSYPTVSDVTNRLSKNCMVNKDVKFTETKAPAGYDVAAPVTVKTAQTEHQSAQFADLTGVKQSGKEEWSYPQYYTAEGKMVDVKTPVVTPTPTPTPTPSVTPTPTPTPTTPVVTPKPTPTPVVTTPAPKPTVTTPAPKPSTPVVTPKPVVKTPAPVVKPAPKPVAKPVVHTPTYIHSGEAPGTSTDLGGMLLGGTSATAGLAGLVGLLLKRNRD